MPVLQIRVLMNETENPGAKFFKTLFRGFFMNYFDIMKDLLIHNGCGHCALLHIRPDQRLA